MTEIHVHHHIHLVDLSGPTGLGQRILSAVGELKDLIIMNDEELKAKLAEINAKTDKVFGEVKGQLESLNTTIAALQEALAASGNTSPEADALVNQALAKLDALDKLIPDAGTPEPVPA